MRRALLPLLTAAALAACEPAPAGDTAGQPASVPASGAGAATRPDTGSHPAWSRHAVIYEVNVRQFTPEGTFAALERHLPRLRGLGVDILWLMPVQPIGREQRKGSLGSYYSISDYTAINPEHGTEADFRRLVDAAHRQGMKVILDWVANHTAYDHAWTREHKDWYTLRPDGSISRPLDAEGKETDWTDVAELNFDNPQLRRAMIEEMRWWTDSMGVDGFRADVAWGIPHDFWPQVRAALQPSRPDLFMLAEAEDPKLHPAFDMTYGWELHHLLNDVSKGTKGTEVLDAYFAKQDSLYPPDAYRMYFTSNHDENSWQGTEFERMGDNHKAAFVLSATADNGMPLLYTGQEASLRKRLRFFDKDTVDWNGPSLAAFYRSMFSLKDSVPALANGGWGGPQVALKTDGGSRVYAFTRTKGPNTVLVAVNFGNAPRTVAYDGLPHPGTYVDWFDKHRVPLAAQGRLEIPAHGYRVLVQ